MFVKLALRNVRRSVKDYSVYFLTLMLGVCVFYVFNSLQSQPVIVVLEQAQSPTVEGILIYMNVLSVFVAVVLAGLILYANHFMLRRRKQELATYLLLGLPQSRLSLLLFLETLAVGLLALCAGVVLGVLAANGLSVLTLWLFALPYTQFSYQFQWAAVGYTAVCFGVVFLLVLVFDLISVSRQTLHRLLLAGRRNETVKQRPLWVAVVTFLVGVALIAAAYFLLLTRGMLRFDRIWLGMLLMGALGTMLFFKGFSGFVLRLCRANEKLYFKGLNFFVLRQWSGKLHSTYLSMTVVCLLLLLAIGATACTLGMNAAIGDMADEMAPFDVMMENHTWNGEQGLIIADFDAALTEGGVDPDSFAQRRTYLLYTGEGGQWVITLPDYNAVMAMEGLPVLTQGELPQTREEYIPGMGSWVDEHDVLRHDYLVVPAGGETGLDPMVQVFVADYPAGADPVDWQERIGPLLSRAVELSDAEGPIRWISQTFRHDIYLDQLGLKVLVLFMGIYLGVTFLITAAAVLALQQLSQSADNAQQYALLRRLGAEEKLRDRALFFQVFLAFFLPLALAVVHAVVGMTAANAVISEISLGTLDTTASSFITAGLILLVYGAYFLLTFFSGRTIVKERASV